MKRFLFLTTLFFFSFFFTKNVFAATEFISVVDTGGAGDYSSLYLWELAIDSDLTSASNKVFGGTKTGTIADGASVTGSISLATGTVYHATATQIYLIVLTGTFQSAEQIQVDGSNYFTTTDAGDSAIAIAKCRATTGVADTTAVTINDWTTSQDNYIKIWTDPSENYRHNGKWDEGKYRLETTNTNSINIYQNYIRIDGLQIKNTANSFYGAIAVSTSTTGGTDYRFSNNIIQIIKTAGSPLAYVFENNYFTVAKIWNSIAYSADDILGIYVNSTSGTLYLYNSTFYNLQIQHYNSGIIVAKNNVAQGHSDNFLGAGGSWGASDYNISDNINDAPSPSYRNNLATALTFVNTTAGSEDFHLTFSDTDAIGDGTNLSADVSLSFSTDIDNHNRPTGVTAWDIGADQTLTASKLAFTTQPSSTAIAGAVFAQQPVVAIQDDYGNTITSDSTSQITLARGNTGTETLQGTLTATASSGVAIFSGIYYNKAETMNITATHSGGASVQTSDTDFNAGTASDTTVSGTGTAGLVQLSASLVPVNEWASPLTVAPGSISYGSYMIRNSSDDDVYVLRGSETTGFYKYSISGNSWTMLTVVPGAVGWGSTMVRNGSDNDIYVLRGNSTANLYKYSISGNSWTTLTSAPGTVSTGGSMIRNGSDNDIYVLSGGNSADLYKYSISGNSWTTLTAAPGAVSNGGFMIRNGSDNYIYVLRGNGANFYRYSISGNSWTTLTSVPAEVYNGSYMIRNSSDNDIYVLRGNGSTSFYKYSISGNSWTTLTVVPGAVDFGSFMIRNSSDDDIYVLRGNGLTDFYKYSISGNSWTTLDVVPEAVYYGGFMIRNGSDNDIYVTPGNDSTSFYKFVIAQNQFVSSGTFTSSVIDTTANSAFGTMSWTATTPASTSITMKARTSNNADMSGATVWASCSALTSGNDISSATGVTDGQRYIQYQATLATSDVTATSTLNDVTINWTPTTASVTSDNVVVNPDGVISNTLGLGTATMNMSLTDKMTNGLVGMWSFDGPDIDWTTNTAYDRSPSGGNNGTISGATAAMGKRGQGMSFNGSSAYVNNDLVANDVATGYYSVSAWIKLSADFNSSSTPMDISRLGDAPSSNDIDFCLSCSWGSADGKLGLAVYSGSTFKVARSAQASWSANTWYHVAGTYDGANAVVYVNGVQDGSIAATSRGSSASSHSRIGAHYPLGYYFNGIIDEVRIYNRALSADEIGDLYRLGEVKYAR